MLTKIKILIFILFINICPILNASTTNNKINFPRELSSYNDLNVGGLLDIIIHRIKLEPFNLFATIVFIMAIIHTFFTSYFLSLAHKFRNQHKEKIEKGLINKNSNSVVAGIFHFFGEIEAVFGIWVVVLALGVTMFYDWNSFVYYVGHKLHYTEPMFVVVIMTLASSRPILKLFELILWKIVKLIGGTLQAWWFVILTIGPLLGSFITEPAAMTVSACLLADKFYDLNPSNKLKYSTIALLFVNVSIGGTLTNFAAPPVLMVAGVWNWDFIFMFLNFGWKSILAILISNLIYFLLFKKDMESLKEEFAKKRFKQYIQRKFIKREELEKRLDDIEYEINQKMGFTETFSKVCQVIKEEMRYKAISSLTKEEREKYDVDETITSRFEDIQVGEMKKSIPGLLPYEIRPPYRDPDWDKREDYMPRWVMLVHSIFILFTVFNAHEPVLFIGGFLFFLGFTQVTAGYQNRLNLKPPLLVAFFLAGLVIHGGLQAWWISPVLGSLSEYPLMLGSTILTAFNDNAAITYLSTFVEGLTPQLKYAVVAGAISGGGLTIIANAPNPAGQSILKKYFKNGISPLQLLKSAIIPLIIVLVIFIIF